MKPASIDTGRTDSLQVEPIRLGGRHDRQRALSLDAKPIPTARFVSPLPENVDVDRLRRDLKLDDDEDRYFVANRLECIGRARISAYLDWTPARAEAVRQRVQRRIVNLRRRSVSIADFVIRGSSLDLAFVEKVAGRPSYSLALLAPSFASIMAEERAHLFQLTSAAANLAGRTKPRTRTIAA